MTGKELTIRCMDTGDLHPLGPHRGPGRHLRRDGGGNDPANLSVRMQVAVVGNRLFRRWVEHALERLQSAAETTTANH